MNSPQTTMNLEEECENRLSILTQRSQKVKNLKEKSRFLKGKILRLYEEYQDLQRSFKKNKKEVERQLSFFKKVLEVPDSSSELENTSQETKEILQQIQTLIEKFEEVEKIEFSDIQVSTGSNSVPGK